jgi:hypothetical protein
LLALLSNQVIKEGRRTQTQIAAGSGYVSEAQKRQLQYAETKCGVTAADQQSSRQKRDILILDLQLPTQNDPGLSSPASRNFICSTFVPIA